MKTKVYFKLMRLCRKSTGAIILATGSIFGAQAQNYLSGDFHQHTTYTDGSYSIQHVMAKNNEYGLDWWANSEHGGGFTKNAAVSGTDLGTSIYWDSYTPNPIIGKILSSGGHQVMWRWQSLRDSSFSQIQLAKTLYPSKIILQGLEWNVPGHEHGSVGLIANQFSATPNCNPIAEFEYKFDNSDGDDVGGVAQGWTKSVLTGHAKTLEAIAWLSSNYPTTSYVVPAHPERQKTYKINHFRDMNDAGPTVCFGFESMSGHQKSSSRGGYSASADGGGTFGGCGVYAAKIGGLWDAILSEGRNFWLFASSDFHDLGGDFYPGEYQKTYTYTKTKTAQGIIDGLRSGNSWVVEGDLIDSLIFNIESIGLDATSVSMGSSMIIDKGKSIKITIKARDPQGINNNTYSAYNNPELNHIDVIKGKISGKILSTDLNYTVDSVTTTSVIDRFDAVGGIVDSEGRTSKKWKNLGNGWVEMELFVQNITDSVYFRLRGTNLGLNLANETDGAGNPLSDVLVGSNDATKAFADLWFYSNPIFVYSNPVKTAKFQIKQVSDDLEERLPAESGQTQTNTVGSVDWSSSDLELGCEGSANASPQMVGLRFPNININKDKTIQNAYLQFEIDEATMVDPCNLFVWSENNDNPLTFTNTNFALTSRPKSADSIAWTVAPGTFNVVDQKANSINIQSLVQDNLNKSGWAAGNAMAFYIKGNGRRVVESYDGEATAAASLVIEYVITEQDMIDMQKADSIAYVLKLKSDSILNTVSGYVEVDYTVPSWTMFLRAKKAIATNVDSTNIANLSKAVNELAAADKPYSIAMSLHKDPTTRMAFNWFTNVGVTGGKVEIVAGKVSDHASFITPLFSIAATCDSVKDLNYNVSANNLSSLAGIPSNTKKSYMKNKALATGLTPNTAYSFRVGKPGAWSEIGTFTTAKATKDEFSFIYFTDPQANTVEMFDISQKTTHKAMDMYPNTNFWLSCGDLVETSGSTNSEWEYEQFFTTQQDIFMKNPFVPVGGNHDKSANKNFAHHFYTDSVSFDHANSTSPGSVYSFVYGDALFMALSYEDYSVAGFLDSLAVWMNQQVKANPTVKWRIAFYHKAMYTGSGSHQSDGDAKTVRDKMAPVFDSLKIDLALQGHDHVYEVIGPVKAKQLVANSVNNQLTVTFDARENVTGLFGGTFNVHEGTLYFLNNSAGRKKYEPRSKTQMDAAETTLGVTNYFGLFNGRFGQTGRPTFSHITVSIDTISITTYEVEDDGSTILFDGFKIVKSNENETNVSSLENTNALSVYPIPVKEFVNISFSTPVSAIVEVHNIGGSIVQQNKIDGNAAINLSELTSGTYFLKIISNGEYRVVKFIKE